PKNFFPRGKKFFPRGKNFWGFLKTPKKGAPFLKTPGGFLKNPRGFFPLFGGKKGAPKNFFPGGKIFPPGEKFLGVFKKPPKRGPLFKTPGVLKTPGVFPPFWGKKGAPKIFPPGKNFSPGEKFWGFLKPQKGPLFKN
ncbi:hypothetical protein ED857_19480, partial [Acinetobacter baumannii]